MFFVILSDFLIVYLIHFSPKLIRGIDNIFILFYSSIITGNSRNSCKENNKSEFLFFWASCGDELIDGSWFVFFLLFLLQLEKLINAWANQRSINAASVRLVFEGRPMLPTQTLEEVCRPAHGIAMCSSFFLSYFITRRAFRARIKWTCFCSSWAAPHSGDQPISHAFVRPCFYFVCDSSSCLLLASFLQKIKSSASGRRSL